MTGRVAEGLQPFSLLPYPSLSPTVVSHPAQKLCQCYQVVITTNTARLGVVEVVGESSLPTATINYYSIRLSYNAYQVISLDSKCFVIRVAGTINKHIFNERLVNSEEPD